MSSKRAEVLVVEDEEGLAELFEIWLGEHYEVEAVTSGQAALDRLASGFEAVVLDWRMPRVSGADILERIQEEEISCGVAVVTGLDPHVADIDDHVDFVLRKPVDRSELVNTVETLVD